MPDRLRRHPAPGRVAALHCAQQAGIACLFLSYAETPPAAAGWFFDFFLDMHWGGQ